MQTRRSFFAYSGDEQLQDEERYSKLSQDDGMGSAVSKDEDVDAAAPVRVLKRQTKPQVTDTTQTDPLRFTHAERLRTWWVV